MSYGHWGEYVPVAERRAQAERELARLRKTGQRTSPVKIEGRTIANTFWGKAWCENLETYQDYENRLPRGRTYVRNGSVVDLQIAPSSVKAMVVGSSMYRVSVTISPLPVMRWAKLREECAGGIDSLIELLQGRLSQNVMERLCHPESGLLPKPSEIKLSCSCPDYSDMCKHVAAALYGVGARLDEQPELIFRLRSVDEKALVGVCNASLPFLTTGAPTRAILAETDLSTLFGLDIAQHEIAIPEAVPAPRKKALPKLRLKARATEINDSHAGKVLPAGKVLAKRNIPALKARSTDKTALPSSRTAKQVRGSKQSQISGDFVRPLTGNKASARSDTRHVVTKVASKQNTQAKKTGALSLQNRSARISRP